MGLSTLTGSNGSTVLYCNTTDTPLAVELFDSEADAWSFVGWMADITPADLREIPSARLQAFRARYEAEKQQNVTLYLDDDELIPPGYENARIWRSGKRGRKL